MKTAIAKLLLYLSAFLTILSLLCGVALTTSDLYILSDYAVKGMFDDASFQEKIDAEISNALSEKYSGTVFDGLYGDWKNRETIYFCGRTKGTIAAQSMRTGSTSLDVPSYDLSELHSLAVGRLTDVSGLEGIEIAEGYLSAADDYITDVAACADAVFAMPQGTTVTRISSAFTALRIIVWMSLLLFATLFIIMVIRVAYNTKMFVFGTLCVTGFMGMIISLGILLTGNFTLSGMGMAVKYYCDRIVPISLTVLTAFFAVVATVFLILYLFSLRKQIRRERAREERRRIREITGDPSSASQRRVSRIHEMWTEEKPAEASSSETVKDDPSARSGHSVSSIHEMWEQGSEAKSVSENAPDGDADKGVVRVSRRRVSHIHEMWEQGSEAKAVSENAPDGDADKGVVRVSRRRVSHIHEMWDDELSEKSDGDEKPEDTKE